MTKEIDPVTSILILIKNTAPVLFSTISTLIGINPVWGILFGTSLGIITAWGDFGQARINELVTYIDEHRDEFVSEIISTEKFKTLFLNILERHMKESSEKKRVLLRNYLLNVGKGVNPEFDEFTRMNNTIDNITLEEIDFLRLWDDDAPVGKYINSHKQFPHAMTISDIQSCIYGMSPRDTRLMSLLEERNQSKNNQILLSLSYKGLLFGLAQDNFGSGQEVRIKEITDFGKAFLSFIRK